ncbi:unnamed protein product [Onchocerca ochengi]|nr:unnamed protein product [Onchocerca ochengi]
MNLWLWAMILTTVSEIAVVSLKKAPQTKKENFVSAKSNRPRSPSSKEIIDQVWTKIKRIVKMVYDKIFWAIAEFFDGKRSYTPRSGKEIQKQLAATEKLIRHNPMDRCRVAIYINIA